MTRIAGWISRLRAVNPMWLAMLSLVVATCTIALWVLSADARREIDLLATANADSSQWSVAQAEVELLTLTNAVVLARAGGSLSEVRQRFDVFYSRVRMIQRSEIFASVREDPDTAAALAGLATFLDRWVRVIDGSDEDLRAQLPTLEQQVYDARAAIRSVVLTSVRVFAHDSEAQRERVASALRDLALIAAALFLILIGSVLALALSLAAGQRQTARIAQAQSRLRAMVGTSLDGILVVGRDGRVLDFNGAAEAIFGYSPAEAIGQPMADLIIPDHLRAAHAAGMNTYLTTGRRKVIDAGRVQLEARDKSGRIFPVEFSVSSAQSDDGEVFISFIRDISDQVAAERNLVEARDQALAGEKAKAELLAVMSHEMRTPLNGLLGSLELLSETALTRPQRQLVDVMDSSGHMLLDHVNTVLDISRVDAGRAVARREAFDLGALIQEVADSQAALAQARGNRVSVRCCPGVPEPVVGDKGRLRQVLVNLLANAIKFTRDGDIVLSAAREPAALGSPDLVEIRVRDSGIGIDPADHARIFEDFVTLDSSYAREVEGTGLGLGIVRRFVEAMEGEISVESVPGEGAEFRLLLPLPVSDETVADGPAPEPAARATARGPIPERAAPRVLVVEDNEINRMLARRMLSDLGCRTDEARDGQEGVDRAARQRFDLIMMDISMPRLDGIEAAHRIRGGGGPNAETPIVALTAHALPADIERFHGAGMTDVAIKPVRKDRLSALLGEILPGRTRPVSLGDAAGAETLAALLGPDEARATEARADAEIAATLAEMRALADDSTALPQIADHAHRLAGLCGVLGRGRLRNEFVSIEILAKDADDPEETCAVLAEILAGIDPDAGQIDPASTM